MKELGPVPFSDTLKKQLKEPVITTQTFQKAVAETASFYYHHIPDLKACGGAYTEAMRDIVRKYPSLEAHGVETWVSF